nr:hypothetical protein [Tanacetum cinerariifolium]
MDQQNPTLAKIPILDIGKFEQWQFRIQQYLQHEHYALLEVIKFRDSYEVPKDVTTGSASDGTGKKKGRTITLTTDDMQKRKNDVKARTTLLLALPDEHQLRFSKHKTAQELWAAILKTFCEEMDIKWNMALLSMRADRFWKKIGKKISIQGIDVAGFDKSKVECFDCHKMGHLARKCKAPRSQDRGRRDNHRQGSKVEEQALKALMAIDGFADDTVTDYSRPSLAIEITSDDAQNRNPSVTETEASPSIISPKPFIKFVKETDSSTETKIAKVETAKPTVKYAAMYSKPSKRVKKVRTCPTNSYKTISPRIVIHKPYRPPMRPMRPYMNAAQPNITSFYKPAHSYTKRPFQRTSAVRSQYRGPRVANVNRKIPTVNRKLPTVNRKFPTGNTKFSTADLSNKGKAVKASACWIWKPTQNLSNKGPNGNSVSMMFNKAVPRTTLMTKAIGTLAALGRDFKLLDDANVLLRTPRQHNMYSIDLNNIVPHKDLTCLVAKASADEGMLWHRRLGHLNFKKINRFTWTFFLKTKDETSGILRKFITKIENLKDLKVKIIRCDNRGEFRNKEMDDFCLQKGIKREFSNARTPQQNGVAERRNRTLIEAARTMVLVNKSHNKTPYELFNGRTPAIGFLKLFGCHVMILNTLDHLGKFEAKGDKDVCDLDEIKGFGDGACDL